MLESLTEKRVQFSLSTSFMYTLIATVFLLTTSSLYAPKSKLIPLGNRQIRKQYYQTQPFKIKRSREKWKEIIHEEIYKAVEQETPVKIESLFNDIETYCDQKKKESLIFNKREGALEIALRCDRNSDVFPTVLEYAYFLDEKKTKQRVNRPSFLNKLVIKNDYKSLRFLSQMEIFFRDPFREQKGKSPIKSAVGIQVPGALILQKLLSNEINKHYYSHHPDKTYQILSKKIDDAVLLSLAVSGENIDAVEVLLNYGADPAALDSENQTSIDIAVVMNTQKSNKMLNPLLSALVQKYPGDDVKNILNQNRIFLDKKHTVLGNPLHRAILDRNLGAVELLLNCGADPAALNSRNQTSIDIATRMNDQMKVLNRNLGATELLLNCGADPVALNSENQTAIELATMMNAQKSKNDMLALLLSYLVQKYPDDAVKNILNQNRIFLDTKHTIMGNILHMAVLHRNISAVELLLNCGADPTALNSRNQTSINIAATLTSKVGHEIFDLLFRRRFG